MTLIAPRSSIARYPLGNAVDVDGLREDRRGVEGALQDVGDEVVGVASNRGDTARERCDIPRVAVYSWLN